MRTAFGIRSLATLVLIGCAAGCASQKAGPPPLLDLTASHCGSAPELTGAAELVYDPKKDENEATAEITSASPCFKDTAGSSLYSAYELPSSPTSYLVRVTSEPEGETLLALRVLLYGSDGSLKREFSGKQIVFRGSALSTIFRSHDDERYLVVASDPAAVGHTDSRLREATQANMAAAYPVYFSYYTGSDVVVKNILSHNGRVIVSLEPLATK